MTTSYLMKKYAIQPFFHILFSKKHPIFGNKTTLFGKQKKMCVKLLLFSLGNIDDVWVLLKTSILISSHKTFYNKL